MTDDRQVHYLPASGPGGSEPAQTRASDLSELEVVATVAVCDLDDPPTANTLPNISMKITQYVRLVDESLVRLDADRGVTAAYHGAAVGDAISWKRPFDEVIAEILVLVRPYDEDDPDEHPWDELAEAARQRGVEVDAATLSRLPFQVLLSAEVVSAFVR